VLPEEEAERFREELDAERPTEEEDAAERRTVEAAAERTEVPDPATVLLMRPLVALRVMPAPERATDVLPIPMPWPALPPWILPPDRPIEPPLPAKNSLREPQL
jgi:hypothetical protein